ncbi:hypothetical protein HK100_005033, partial [Physocladia obscura]
MFIQFAHHLTGKNWKRASDLLGEYAVSGFVDADVVAAVLGPGGDTRGLSAYLRGKPSKFTVKADAVGKIEDQGVGCLQTDFANELIGGGILDRGAVQEEILFAIYPEMLASMLFCERMADNEVIFFTGCERFSKYSGYSESFRITEPFNDPTLCDAKNRRLTEFVAMDATYFRKSTVHLQFDEV